MLCRQTRFSLGLKSNLRRLLKNLSKLPGVRAQRDSDVVFPKYLLFNGLAIFFGKTPN